MSLVIAMLVGPAAWADGSRAAGADPATKTLPAKAPAAATSKAFGQAASTGADPATKTLPAAASDQATANAFGQQGARTSTAHQAARAAAAREAHAAVDQAQAQPGATVRPSAAATAHASATGVAQGFDRATAGAANSQAGTHRR